MRKKLIAIPAIALAQASASSRSAAAQTALVQMQ